MSAPRDDSVYVDHIRDSIARIEEYLRGVTEADFMAAPLIQDAVKHQIQIIGEASSRLSPAFRDRSSAIPWTDIIGMRHKIVHDYLGVDLDQVWETAVRDIPALKQQLQQL